MSRLLKNQREGQNGLEKESRAALVKGPILRSDSTFRSWLRTLTNERRPILGSTLESGRGSRSQSWVK